MSILSHKTRFLAKIKRNPEAAFAELLAELPGIIDDSVQKEVKSQVSEAQKGSFLAEIESLKGKKGDPGEQGESGAEPTQERLLVLIRAVTTEMKDVLKGKDGHSPTLVEMERVARDVVNKAKTSMINKAMPLKTDLRTMIVESLEKHRKMFTGPIGGLGGKGKRGEKGDRGSADTPEEIKGKLIQLPVREGWFDWNHLKNVPSFADAVKRVLHRGGSVTRNSDISSQTDGSTRTFTVPSHTSIVALLGSDYPNVYIPTTDFTTSGQTLTIDSAVDSPSNGATLIFLYNE